MHRGEVLPPKGFIGGEAVAQGFIGRIEGRCFRQRDSYDSSGEALSPEIFIGFTGGGAVARGMRMPSLQTRSGAAAGSLEGRRKVGLELGFGFGFGFGLRLGLVLVLVLGLGLGLGFIWGEASARGVHRIHRGGGCHQKDP